MFTLLGSGPIGSAIFRDFWICAVPSLQHSSCTPIKKQNHRNTQEQHTAVVSHQNMMNARMLLGVSTATASARRTTRCCRMTARTFTSTSAFCSDKKYDVVVVGEWLAVCFVCVICVVCRSNSSSTVTKIYLYSSIHYADKTFYMNSHIH